jgi:histidinol-phosphatase
MLVAEGAVDIAVEPSVTLWDLAASYVIVEAAGGRFTDLDGKPGPDGGSVIATNGLLHDAVVEALNADA